MRELTGAIFGHQLAAKCSIRQGERLELYRAEAVMQLRLLARNAIELAEQLESNDANVCFTALQYHTSHAGYSNTLTTKLAQAESAMAKMMGVVEGVVEQ